MRVWTRRLYLRGVHAYMCLHMNPSSDCWKSAVARLWLAVLWIRAIFPLQTTGLTFWCVVIQPMGVELCVCVCVQGAIRMFSLVCNTSSFSVHWQEQMCKEQLHQHRFGCQFSVAVTLFAVSNKSRFYCLVKLSNYHSWVDFNYFSYASVAFKWFLNILWLL